jgi:hypothetical protein
VQAAVAASPRACEFFAACLLMPRLWVKGACFERSALNGIDEIVQRGRQSRRAICSVDPSGVVPDVDT